MSLSVTKWYARRMVSRAEHRRATLLQISAATTAAFEAHGASATFDDVAARAGLSRRTLFRYVESREDLLFIHPMLWLEIFDDAVAEKQHESLRDRMMFASRRISEHIDADPTPVRRAMTAAMSDPAALARGNANANRKWIDRIASEARGDATNDDAIFKATVLGGAIMGVIDAALGAWFVSNGDVPLVDFVEQGLDYLSPIIE